MLIELDCPKEPEFCGDSHATLHYVISHMLTLTDI